MGETMPDPTTGSPWQHLTRELKTTLVQADRLTAALRDNVLYVDTATELGLLDQRARLITVLAARCRADIYGRLRDAGWPVTRIATEMGVSVQAVYKTLRDDVHRGEDAS